MSMTLSRLGEHFSYVLTDLLRAAGFVLDQALMQVCVKQQQSISQSHLKMARRPRQNDGSELNADRRVPKSDCDGNNELRGPSLL